MSQNQTSNNASCHDGVNLMGAAPNCQHFHHHDDDDDDDDDHHRRLTRFLF